MPVIFHFDLELSAYKLSSYFLIVIILMFQKSPLSLRACCQLITDSDYLIYTLLSINCECEFNNFNMINTVAKHCCMNNIKFIKFNLLQ